MSIEEQYYLLLPAFLAFVPRRYWVPGGLVLFLASLGLCLGLQPYKPIATFYLLPTRGWELGVGSMVALIPALMGRIRPLLAVLFWPAVAVLAVIPVFPTGLPHPGPDALLVCLATAVVIARRHPLLGRSLLSRSLARIGDVSYSLYLAHWPPFAFLKNASVAGVTPTQNLLTLLLGIVLGLLLYRFVEMPTRRWQPQPSRGFAFGTLVTSCCVIGAPVAMAAGVVSAGVDYAHLRRANDGFSAACVYETPFSPKAACQSGENPAVMVWGDSFAMHLVPGIAATSGRGAQQATRGNCAPAVGLAALSDVFYQRPWSEACMEFNDSVLAYLREAKSIEVVVLSSPFRQLLTPEDAKHHWRTLARVDGQLVEGEASLERASAAMRETLRALTAMGKRVVLVAPPPGSGFNIGTCVERRAQGKLVLGAPRADCDVPVGDYHRMYARTRQLLEALKGEPGVEVVSLDGLLCDASRCVSSLDGQAALRGWRAPYPRGLGAGGAEAGLRGLVESAAGRCRPLRRAEGLAAGQAYIATSDWRPHQLAPGASSMGSRTAAASTHSMRRKPSAGMSARAAHLSSQGFHTTTSGKFWLWMPIARLSSRTRRVGGALW